jgi:hypothetical protein
MKSFKHIIIGILAFGYIVFEKIFWEKFAVHIINHIKEKDFYNKFETLILASNRYIILLSFILFFSVSEIMGLYALILFSKGMLIFGIIMYIVKLLPVIVAFSLLEKAKDKLYSFNWFKISHIFILKWINELKESKSYIAIRTKIAEIKSLIISDRENKFLHLFKYSVSKQKGKR